jgi:hypothetical protein
MTDFDQIRALWTTQPIKPFTLSVDELRMRTGKFHARIRQRNFTEYLAALLVIGVFGWMAWLIPVPVAKAGAILIIFGAVYVGWKLHTIAGSAPDQQADNAARLLDHHRAELLRQRDSLASVWRWYLAPFVPGTVLFVAGVNFAPEVGLPIWTALTSLAVALSVVAGVFAAILWLNQRAVKQLDAEITELDRIRVDSGE